ncbi:MAG: gliding motility-associated C-terminal domain-containing protein [Lewinella sp.]|nr:gliding motility-associated C-terminal domain-containing protein [Lewinella sp.]
MRGKIIVAISAFLLLCTSNAAGQNLIADPGFEIWDGNQGFSPFTLAPLTYWYTANGTADHHHVDIMSGSNLTGLEPCPLGEGNTWCGYPYEGGGVLGCWKGNGPDGSKEWAGTQLLEPLVPGDCYEISFWIQNKKDNPNSLYETNHWGVFFSQTQFPTFNANLADFSTMADHWVTCEQVIGGSEWQQVTFAYTASEDFQYMYIGYMGNVANSTFTAANDDYLLGFYVWIDQVIVEHVDVDVPPTQTICRGDGVQLDFTSNYPLSWTDGIVTDTTRSIWVSPEVTTTYYVEATGNMGCTKLDSVIVEVLQPVMVDYPAIVCPATEPFRLEPEAPAGTWTGAGIIDAAAGLFDPSLTGPGLAEALFTAADDCADDFTMLIEVAPIPEVTITTDLSEGCWPLTVTFTDESPNPAEAYTWDFGDGETSQDAGSVQHTFTNAGAYGLGLTLTHFPNCTVSYEQVNEIRVYEPPVAAFSYTPEKPDLINNEVQFTDISSGNTYQWSWDFGDLSGSSHPTPLHTYATPGAYQVRLRVTSEGHCVDSIQQTLLVDNAVRMYIPNAFSPNDDGRNDRFQVGYIGQLMEYQMTVFNRWGGLVFQSDDPLLGWDGKAHNGQLAETGVYTYIIEYLLLPATPTGEEVREKEMGDVLLLK